MPESGRQHDEQHPARLQRRHLLFSIAAAIRAGLHFCQPNNPFRGSVSMPATLTIRDESLSGESLHEWALEVLTEKLTVRELIRGRVYQEVQDHNLRNGDVFRGFIQ